MNCEHPSYAPDVCDWSPSSILTIKLQSMVTYHYRHPVW